MGKRMGAYLIRVPELIDAELIYSENETKFILKFFFESRETKISKLLVTNDVRRFAQTLMIAALQGSYEMGFVEDVFNVLSGIVQSGKYSGVMDLCKKLAKRFAKRWFQHMSQQDIDNPKIYISVRNSLSNSMVSHMDYFFGDTQASLPRSHPSRGIHQHIMVHDANRRFLSV
jgi:hypothetical protein